LYKSIYVLKFQNLSKNSLKVRRKKSTNMMKTRCVEKIIFGNIKLFNAKK
jgi:hypothetical protein